MKVTSPVPLLEGWGVIPSSTPTTIKEQILEKIDQLPESALLEVLEFVRSLKARHQPQLQQSDAWKAYLASKQERKEVYRRLASS